MVLGGTEVGGAARGSSERKEVRQCLAEVKVRVSKRGPAPR